MAKSSQNGQNCIPFFELHILKCKENIYLEYEYQLSTSSHRLMIYIKHQPGIKHQTGIQFRLTFDEKMFFRTSKYDKVQSKRRQNCTHFLNLHALLCKENIYLEYMNINHQPRDRLSNFQTSFSLVTSSFSLFLPNK